jgi:hypothetical protein
MERASAQLHVGDADVLSLFHLKSTGRVRITERLAGYVHLSRPRRGVRPVGLLRLLVRSRSLVCGRRPKLLVPSPPQSPPATAAGRAHARRARTTLSPWPLAPVARAVAMCGLRALHRQISADTDWLRHARVKYSRRARSRQLRLTARLLASRGAHAALHVSHACLFPTLAARTPRASSSPPQPVPTARRFRLRTAPRARGACPIAPLTAAPLSASPQRLRPLSLQRATRPRPPGSLLSRTT